MGRAWGGGGGSRPVDGWVGGILPVRKGPLRWEGDWVDLGQAVPDLRLKGVLYPAPPFGGTRVSGERPIGAASFRHQSPGRRHADTPPVHTHTYTRKYQPAESFSLYGASPPPPPPRG